MTTAPMIEVAKFLARYVGWLLLAFIAATILVRLAPDNPLPEWQIGALLLAGLVMVLLISIPSRD